MAKKKAKKVAKKKEHSHILRKAAYDFIKNSDVREKIISMDIPEALYERAGKLIGMTDEMIASYRDVESLKKACDGMHPRSNMDTRVKVAEIAEPVKYEENMPDKFEIESKMECTFVMQNRAQFDETNLQAELRRINRKYGTQKPVKIIKTVTFEQISGRNKEQQMVKFYITKYDIYFKKG